MAINPIKKLRMIVPNNNVDSFFVSLQSLGILQLEQFPFQKKEILNELGYVPDRSIPFKQKSQDINILVARLEKSLNFLSQFEETTFLDSLMPNKYIVRRGDDTEIHYVCNKVQKNVTIQQCRIVFHVKTNQIIPGMIEGIFFIICLYNWGNGNLGSYSLFFLRTFPFWIFIHVRPKPTF